MKNIIKLILKDRLLQNKIIKIIMFLLFCSVIIIYIYLLKFVLPIPFISYENYHGIHFLNNIHNIINGGYIDYIINYINNIFIGNVGDDGNSNIIIYSLITNIFSIKILDIFYIQSFISIISYIFFSLFIYNLLNKNYVISIILFMLLLSSPNQIKYGLSEEYYILGNFLISTSLLCLILFLNKQKIIYYILFILCFILSIYSRTLYLLYIPVFMLIILYRVNFGKDIFKRLFIYTSKNIHLISLIIITLTVLVFSVNDRYNILNNQSGTFSAYSTGFFIIDILFSFYYIIFNVKDDIFSYLYTIFIYSGLIFGLIYFLKNKKYKSSIVFILFFLFIAFLIYKYYNIGIALQRHLLLLEPLYLFLAAIGIYGSYVIVIKYFKLIIIKKIIFFIIIFIIGLYPFFHITYIKQNYSIQKEFLFLYDNIEKLGNVYNLIIPNNNINKVNYDFPAVIFKKINYKDIQIFNISLNEENRYKNFIYNNITKKQNNIFYLSTACYSFGDYRDYSNSDFGLREDCKNFIMNYKLETIIEKQIPPETYIIPYFNQNTKYITIGFYKIIGKK